MLVFDGSERRWKRRKRVSYSLRCLSEDLGKGLFWARFALLRHPGPPENRRKGLIVGSAEWLAEFMRIQGKCELDTGCSHATPTSYKT